MRNPIVHRTSALHQSMSAFDFNRTAEDPSSRITARDLQKARRSAARSTIKKPKSPRHHPKHSFNAARSIKDEMSFESRTTVALVSCEGASGADIRSDLQASIVSNSSNGCPERNPVADSIRSDSITHELSTEVHALLMQSFARPLQLASLALMNPPLSLYFGSSQSPSTLLPWPPLPQLQIWPLPQQRLPLPTFQ